MWILYLITMRTCDEISTPNTKVAIRLDLNVSYNQSEGTFVNHSRHKAHSTTINSLKNRDVDIILLSHNDLKDEEVMKRNCEVLENYIDGEIRYDPNSHPTEIFDEIGDEIVMYKNLSEIEECIVEYESIDKSSNTEIVGQFANQVDAYVNDCFSLSHKKIPTITGIPSRVPGYAGKFMKSEYEVIENIRDKTDTTPFIFGGNELTRNIKNIEKIFNSDIDSRVLTMGLTGSAFLQADGYDLGEKTRDTIQKKGSDNIIDRAKRLLVHYGDQIRTPKDVATTETKRSEYALSATPITEKITDIGSGTCELYNGLINNSDLVVATGVTTYSENLEGQESVYRNASEADYSIVVGDKTVTFCDKLEFTGFKHTSSYIDPVIELLIGNDIPGVDVLLP
jgi:phosphoglycerate kinase